MPPSGQAGSSRREGRDDRGQTVVVGRARGGPRRGNHKLPREQLGREGDHAPGEKSNRLELTGMSEAITKLGTRRAKQGLGGRLEPTPIPWNEEADRIESESCKKAMDTVAAAIYYKVVSRKDSELLRPGTIRSRGPSSHQLKGSVRVGEMLMYKKAYVKVLKVLGDEELQIDTGSEPFGERQPLQLQNVNTIPVDSEGAPLQLPAFEDELARFSKKNTELENAIITMTSVAQEDEKMDPAAKTPTMSLQGMEEEEQGKGEEKQLLPHADDIVRDSRSQEKGRPTGSAESPQRNEADDHGPVAQKGGVAPEVMGNVNGPRSNKHKSDQPKKVDANTRHIRSVQPLKPAKDTAPMPSPDAGQDQAAQLAAPVSRPTPATTTAQPDKINFVLQDQDSKSDDSDSEAGRNAKDRRDTVVDRMGGFDEDDGFGGDSDNDFGTLTDCSEADDGSDGSERGQVPQRARKCTAVYMKEYTRDAAKQLHQELQAQGNWDRQKMDKMRGSGFRWRTVYCSLSVQRFCWFTKPGDHDPSTNLNLSTIQAQEVYVDPARPTEFQVSGLNPKTGNLRRYRFRCPEAQLAEAWVKGIGEHLNLRENMVRLGIMNLG